MKEYIAQACGGDIRKAMNAVELLLSAAKRQQGKLLVTLSDAETVAQKSAMRYDREGDAHFDIASALMKSLRGSDPDAALHYLARLLEAGDMLTAIRRRSAGRCPVPFAAGTAFWKILLPWIPSVKQPGQCPGRISQYTVYSLANRIQKVKNFSAKSPMFSLSLLTKKFLTSRSGSGCPLPLSLFRQNSST